MKKAKRSVWILAIGIVLVASVVALFCTANIRGYSRAQRLYDNGKYSEAYKIYSGLGDYRDSEKLAGDAKTRATYSEAEELFKAEDYEKASEMYGQIPEYEDAAEKKEQSQHLLKVKKEKFMKDKMVYVLCVRTILNSLKWRATISLHGM